MKQYSNNNKGFTLIEVLVFVVIFAFFFVAVASILATTLNNLKYSEHKVVATRYAEEAMEWAKSKKEENWGNFYGQSSIAGKIYCFNSNFTNTTTWPGSTLSCTSYTGISGSSYPDKIFNRQLTLTAASSGTTQVTVESLVTWQEGGRTNEARITESLNQGQ